MSLLESGCATNVRLLNPDFKYYFFDNEEKRAFVEQEFPFYRKVYDSFLFPIQRYDFFRYLAVYKYGGFYLDLDILLSESLTPLLNCDCVFAFEALTLSRFLRNECGMDWEIGNYAFGATPRHPFIENLIENCIKSQQDLKWVETIIAEIPRPFRSEYYVLCTTGPRMVTRTLAENPALADSISILFPDDVCNEHNWNQFGKYGVHLAYGSWRKHGDYVRRFSARLWRAWLSRSLLKESKKIGKTRHGSKNHI